MNAAMGDPEEEVNNQPFGYLSAEGLLQGEVSGHLCWGVDAGSRRLALWGCRGARTHEGFLVRCTSNQSQLLF